MIMGCHAVAGFCLVLLQIVLLVTGSNGAGSSGGSLSPNSERERAGPLEVRLLVTQSSCSRVAIARTPSDPSYRSPPTRVLFAFPSNSSGEYPVVLFKHGMSVDICDHTQLMSHIASHGYIVVAPQESTFSQLWISDAYEEIDRTARVVNWLPGNLTILLATDQAASARPVVVTPNLGKLFLAGHSRGGKVVYALALGLARVDITLMSSFSGLIALCPVDGSRIFGPLRPAITSRSDCELGFPTLIEGTGRGGTCVPSPYNHYDFFSCTVAPIVYHLVPSQYGHMDFLDDGIVINWMARVCGTGGRDRTSMRHFTGGLIVSFLESALAGTTQPMHDILANWQSASVKLDEPQCSSNGTSIACPALSYTSSLTAREVDAVASTADSLTVDPLGHTEL